MDSCSIQIRIKNVKEEMVGKGRGSICKEKRTSNVVSLSSAGLQPSITNYHIETLFSCLAPLSTKCCVGKNNPQAEQQWEKNNRGCVIHPLLFVFHACFLAFII